MAAPKGNAYALKFDASAKALFIEELGRRRFLRRAARVVGVDPVTVYAHCKSDAAFAAAVESVRRRTVEDLEHAAYSRAVSGVTRPVVQNGRVVKEVGPDGIERSVCFTQYSDRLLIFLCRTMMPEKYGRKRRLAGPTARTGVVVVPQGQSPSAVEQSITATYHSARPPTKTNLKPASDTVSTTRIAK